MFKELFEKEKIQNEDLKRVIQYTYVGFSHRKMFKKSAWDRGVQVMNELIKLGLVIPFDYGRGKGKYTTTEAGEKYSIEELGKLAYDSGLRIKPLKGEVLQDYYV